MPYKEGTKWRAHVKFKGERFTCLKDTKEAAKRWEAEEKKRLKSLKKETSKKEEKGLGLYALCVKYLEYSDAHFSKTVIKEKRGVSNRIMTAWGSEIILDNITPEMCEAYLIDQRKKRTAHAANKDRKFLLAMWNKGVETYGVKSNPWKGTKNFPHDRQAQYVPQPDDVLKVLMAAGGQDRVMLDPRGAVIWVKIEGLKGDG